MKNKNKIKVFNNFARKSFECDFLPKIIVINTLK